MTKAIVAAIVLAVLGITETISQTARNEIASAPKSKTYTSEFVHSPKSDIPTYHNGTTNPLGVP